MEIHANYFFRNSLEIRVTNQPNISKRIINFFAQNSRKIVGELKTFFILGFLFGV